MVVGPLVSWEGCVVAPGVLVRCTSLECLMFITYMPPPITFYALYVWSPTYRVGCHMLLSLPQLRCFEYMTINLPLRFIGILPCDTLQKRTRRKDWTPLGAVVRENIQLCQLSCPDVRWRYCLVIRMTIDQHGRTAPPALMAPQPQSND